MPPGLDTGYLSHDALPPPGDAADGVPQDSAPDAAAEEMEREEEPPAVAPEPAAGGLLPKAAPRKRAGRAPKAAPRAAVGAAAEARFVTKRARRTEVSEKPQVEPTQWSQPDAASTEEVPTPPGASGRPDSELAAPSPRVADALPLASSLVRDFPGLRRRLAMRAAPDSPPARAEGSSSLLLRLPTREGPEEPALLRLPTREGPEEPAQQTAPAESSPRRGAAPQERPAQHVGGSPERPKAEEPAQQPAEEPAEEAAEEPVEKPVESIDAAAKGGRKRPLEQPDGVSKKRAVKNRRKSFKQAANRPPASDDAADRPAISFKQAAAARRGRKKKPLASLAEAAEAAAAAAAAAVAAAEAQAEQTAGSPAGKVGLKRAHSEGPQASVAGGTLRERLAQRERGSPPGFPEASPAAAEERPPASETSCLDDQLPEHSALGGMALRWRLTLRGAGGFGKDFDDALKAGRKVDEVAKSSDAAGNPDPGPPSGAAESPSETKVPGTTQSVKIATPCRSQRDRPSQSSPPPPQEAPAATPGRRGSASSPVASSAERSAAGSPGDTTSPFLQGEAPRPAGQSVGDLGVKELKGLLAEHGLDFSRCVEKADLAALWQRFEALRKKPLPELRALSLGVGGGRRPPPSAAADELARFLLAPPPPQPQPAAASGANDSPARAAAAAAAAQGVGSNGSPGTAQREQAALLEVRRMLGIQKSAYPTQAHWGLALLGVARGDANLPAVQRAYRTRMKSLHPDRVGDAPGVTRAMELLREAKVCCERALSHERPPGQPRALSYEVLCATAGHRRVRLRWSAPEADSESPVRRYIIAAVDPAYGRALSVAILEPDYSEELKRFVPVEELDSYILSEQELRKMPGLFRQATATLQVAASNEAGQSPWATARVSWQSAAASKPRAPHTSEAASKASAAAASAAATAAASGAAWAARLTAPPGAR